MNIETKYYGIYISKEGDKYWITDSSGCDEYFGTKRPTEQDVENYRNDVI